MTRGKQICGMLKSIRRRIAEANGIEYVASDCRHEGDCSGTCPRCEAEAAALWRQLDMRHAAGRAVALVGLSAGLLTASAQSSVGTGHGCESCHNSCQPAAAGGAVSDVENGDTTKLMRHKGKAELRAETDDDNPQLFGMVNDTMPQFNGGVKALTDYVKNAVDSLISVRGISLDTLSADSRCIVRFVVRKDGCVDQVEVIRALNDELDRVAVDVVKGMPRWIPGRKNGVSVDVRYVLPVIFRTYSGGRPAK